MHMYVCMCIYIYIYIYIFALPNDLRGTAPSPQLLSGDVKTWLE